MQLKTGTMTFDHQSQSPRGGESEDLCSMMQWSTPPPCKRSKVYVSSRGFISDDLEATRLELRRSLKTLNEAKRKFTDLKKLQKPRRFEAHITIHAVGKLRVRLGGIEGGRGVSVVSVEGEKLPHGIQVGDRLVKMDQVDMFDEGIDTVHKLLQTKKSPHSWTFLQQCHITIHPSEIGYSIIREGIEICRETKHLKPGDRIIVDGGASSRNPIEVLSHLFFKRHSVKLVRGVYRSCAKKRTPNNIDISCLDLIEQEITRIDSDIFRISNDLEDVHQRICGESNVISPACDRRQPLSSKSVSALCPISSKRIRYPVLGNACEGHQCFDRDAFKSIEAHQSNFQQIQCPLCHQFVNKLIPDNGFYEILLQYPDAVQFYMDPVCPIGTSPRYSVNPITFPPIELNDPVTLDIDHVLDQL